MVYAPRTFTPPPPPPPLQPPRATRLDFERPYPDGSGVEFAVSYTRETIFSEVAFTCGALGSTVRFPIEQIDFLLGSLQRIKIEASR